MQRSILKLVIVTSCFFNAFSLAITSVQTKSTPLSETTVIDHHIDDDNKIVLKSKKDNFPNRRFDLAKLNLYFNRPANKIQVEALAYNIDQLHYYADLPLELILQIGNSPTMSLLRKVKINLDILYEYMIDTTNINQNENLHIGLDFH